MPGGIMQLTAYGAQDLYLTGNPDITFFKYVYRRYSNFSMEYIQVPFHASPTLSYTQNTICSCYINRHGDLLYDGYIVFTLPALFSVKTDKVSLQNYINNYPNKNEELTGESLDGTSNTSNESPDGTSNTSNESPDSTSITCDRLYTDNQKIDDNDGETPSPNLADINLCKLMPDVEPISYVENAGNVLLYSVEILVNSLIVDKQYGRWMTIWNELTLPEGKREAYRNMISADTLGGSYTTPIPDSTETNDIDGPSVRGKILVSPAKKIYIPLPFWFCQNPGLAIPLVALQNSPIRIDIEFRPLNDIIRIGMPPQSPAHFFDGYNNADYNVSLEGHEQNSLYNTYLRDLLADDTYHYNQVNIFNRYTPSWKQNCYLLMNYVYLSDDERIRFAQNSHEYLITQVQHIHGDTMRPGTTKHFSLSTFNHPVKEIVWALQREEVKNTNDWDNYILHPTPLYDATMFLKKMNKDVLNNKYLMNIVSSALTPSVLKEKNGVSNYSTTSAIPTDSVKSTANDILIELLENANVWDEQNPDTIQVNPAMNFIDIQAGAKLIFNGVDRFSEEDSYFFTNLQSYKYHSNVGLRGTYKYSFAVNPEDQQPSGTCNMSRIANTELVIYSVNQSHPAIRQYNVYIYAVNYNVFRIMAGMGSLVFAN